VLPSARAQFEASLNAQRNALKRMIQGCGRLMKLPADGPSAVAVSINFSDERPGKN
jgi:hypothetical protein